MTTIVASSSSNSSTRENVPTCNVLPKNDTDKEWKYWYCVMLERCNKCHYVNFSGCRAQQQQQCCSNKVANESTISHVCNIEHLRTIPLKVNNRMEVFCYGDMLNGKNCYLPPSPNQYVSSMCKHCKQSDIGFERFLVKVKKTELKYALRSFPSGKDIIEHSMILCKCCRAIGFPGVDGELTTINGATGSAFFAEGDDTKTVQREMEDWDIDHTPDCTCMMKTACDDIEYIDISTTLAYDELEYACRAVKRSSSCLNLAKKAQSVADNVQTRLAVINNKVLNEFEKCVDDDMLQSCMNELLMLLSHNEAFLTIAENDFPILVLSNIESFIVKAKQLRKRIGDNCWNRKTARAFGQLLKKAKSLRKRRSSRKSKVLFMPEFDSGALSSFGKKNPVGKSKCQQENMDSVSNCDLSKLRIRSSSS